jgi:nudix-type nucleoside diphosphatase (YffH/AdpP family)
MRIVGRKVLFEGWTKFLAVTLQRPDGRSTERAVLDHGASVCVLPYDPERRLALVVCQPRIPLLYLGCPEQLMEAIAGRVEGEQPPEAVRREAMEEAGLRIRDLEFVATCWSSPGVSTERFHLYLAPYSLDDRIGKGGGRADEFEDIIVREIALSKLAQFVDKGLLTDSKSFLLVQTLRLRRPDLFEQ